MIQGLIKGAFVAREWKPVTAENFPGLVDDGTFSGRFGFEGEEAEESVLLDYVGKRVPEDFRKRGAQNPIRYTW